MCGSRGPPSRSSRGSSPEAEPPTGDPEAEPEPAAIALAEGLTRLGGEEAETQLLRLMAREEEDVQLKALAGLDRHGGRESVGPLKELARTALRAEVRHVGRSALEAVLERLGDTDDGQLALSDPGQEAGHLSPTAEGGRLTLPRRRGAPSTEPRRLDEVFPELRRYRQPPGDGGAPDREEAS